MIKQNLNYKLNAFTIFELIIVMIISSILIIIVVVTFNTSEEMFKSSIVDGNKRWEILRFTEQLNTDFHKSQTITKTSSGFYFVTNNLPIEYIFENDKVLRIENDVSKTSHIKFKNIEVKYLLENPIYIESLSFTNNDFFNEDIILFSKQYSRAVLFNIKINNYVLNQ